MLFACRAGLPAAVLRLPQTVRASTGFTQPNDIAARLYAAITDVQTMPRGFSFQRQNHTVEHPEPDLDRHHDQSPAAARPLSVR